MLFFTDCNSKSVMDKEKRKTRKKSSTVQGGGVKPDLMLDVVGVLLMLVLVLLLAVVVLMLLHIEFAAWTL